MKSIKPFEEFVKPAINYVDYIAENLDKSIYSEYITEKLGGRPIGISGYSGTSGAIGVQGYSGSSGAIGVQGYSGSSCIGSTWLNNYANAHQEKQLPVMLEDFHIIKNENTSTLEDFFPTMHLLNE